MGPLALAVPHLPATNVRRMGRRIQAPCFLGTSVLPATAREGDVTSDRRPGIGVQMDAGPFSRLAAAYALRRISLSHRLATPWFTTAAPRGARLMKKSCSTLDSPPQGVCSAWNTLTVPSALAPVRLFDLDAIAYHPQLHLFQTRFPALFELSYPLAIPSAVRNIHDDRTKSSR